MHGARRPADAYRVAAPRQIGGRGTQHEAHRGTATGRVNGLAGLELPDTHRIGCAGMIPAPDVADVQARIWDLMERGEHDQAEALHRFVLPIATFMMMPRTAEHFAAYGKPFFARRAGMAAPHQRRPCVEPHPLGASILDRLGRGLPAL